MERMSLQFTRSTSNPEEEHSLSKTSIGSQMISLRASLEVLPS